MFRKMRLPIPPAIQEYTWRAATRQDVPLIYAMLLEIQVAGQGEGAVLLDDLYHQFDSPSTRPQSDTLLAITPDGKAVALAWIFGSLGTKWEHRLFLWGEVHPDYTLHGLGGFILTWLETRGRQILLERPANLPRGMELRCAESQPDRIELFKSHGFKPVKHTYRMRRDLHQPIPEMPLPERVTLCNWKTELNNEILSVFNDAYSDDPHFEPFDEELWQIVFANSKDFRPDLSFLALADQGYEGDQQVIGFCMDSLYAEDTKIAGQREGWIHDLGVMRDWRGQGIASALACFSMQAFAREGLDYAGLNVDASNPTQAQRLYEKLGFYPINHTITFYKAIEG